MISKDTLLDLWQQYSGQTLSPERRQLFYQRCEPLLRFDETAIRHALDVASIEQNFRLVRLEQIARDRLGSKTDNQACAETGIEGTQQKQRSQPAEARHQRGKPHSKNADRRRSARSWNLDLDDERDESWRRLTDPKPLADTELHRKIGPPQKYGDDL